MVFTRKYHLLTSGFRKQFQQDRNLSSGPLFVRENLIKQGLSAFNRNKLANVRKERFPHQTPDLKIDLSEELRIKEDYRPERDFWP